MAAADTCVLAPLACLTPAGAQVTEGVYPTTLLVNEFGYEHVVGDNVTINLWQHVTAEECMPTSIRGFNPYSKKGQPDIDSSMVRDFFDVVLGVADPNVFVVPEGCKPRPPKPPPGPSPPHSVCTPALEKACGPLEHKGKTCTDCTARNAASLRAAGCTAAIEAAFCKAPPHTACTPALDKACAPVEHKGQPCFACVARNKAALIKAGCTPTAEGAFCSLAPTPSPSPPKPPAPSPPHSVCRPALEKACGDDEHKGAVCTACITRNKATLTHAGCTAAMEVRRPNNNPLPAAPPKRGVQSVHLHARPGHGRGALAQVKSGLAATEKKYC